MFEASLFNGHLNEAKTFGVILLMYYQTIIMPNIFDVTQKLLEIQPFSWKWSRICLGKNGVLYMGISGLSELTKSLIANNFGLDKATKSHNTIFKLAHHRLSDFNIELDLIEDMYGLKLHLYEKFPVQTLILTKFRKKLPDISV